jgi:hypothetical protein
MTHEKKSHDYAKRRKNKKTKNSLLWLLHIIGLGSLGLAAVIVPIHVFGVSFSAVVGVYLGYKVLRLVMRLFSLVMASVFTFVFIVILITVISLLIF